VESVAFGPGGTTLAAGDANGRICLWHITRSHAGTAAVGSRAFAACTNGPFGIKEIF
jgi:hypothetical protein